MIGPDGRDTRCVGHGYCGTAGPAYSIMVVDVTAGTYTPQGVARLLYQDWHFGYPDGAAGYGFRGMFWHGNTNVIFGSEKTGYVHVVMVSVGGGASSGAGGNVTDLTPAQCDNQAYYMYDGQLYLVHNCDSVDSLGMAVVDVDTGARTTIVAAGNNTVSGMTDEGAGLVVMPSVGIAYIETAWNESASIMFLAAAGSSTSTSTITITGADTSPGTRNVIYARKAVHITRLPAIVTAQPNAPPPSFDNSAFVVPQLVTFKAADGVVVHAQLFLPKTPLPEKAAVIFTHGGCQRQMYAAFHYDLDYG